MHLDPSVLSLYIVRSIVIFHQAQTLKLSLLRLHTFTHWFIFFTAVTGSVYTDRLKQWPKHHKLYNNSVLYISYTFLRLCMDFYFTTNQFLFGITLRPNLLGQQKIQTTQVGQHILNLLMIKQTKNPCMKCQKQCHH